eukprot:193762-Amphidinium_carterae.1
MSKPCCAPDFRLGSSRKHSTSRKKSQESAFTKTPPIERSKGEARRKQKLSSEVDTQHQIVDQATYPYKTQEIMAGFG